MNETKERVERLRMASYVCATISPARWATEMSDAADCIERLTAELAALREANNKIADKLARGSA